MFTNMYSNSTNSTNSTNMFTNMYATIDLQTVAIYALLVLMLVLFAIWIKPKKSKKNQKSKTKTLIDKIKEFEDDQNSLLIITNYIENLHLVKNFFLKYRIMNLNKIGQLDIFYKFIDNNKNKKLHIILHTDGGLSCIADIITNTLLKNNNINTYVPYFAFSSGSQIALAGNTFMHKNGFIGPSDVIMRDYSVQSLIEVVNKKTVKNISENKLLKSIDLKKEYDANIKLLENIFKSKRLDESTVKKLATYFGSGKLSHDVCISVDELLKLGLKINTKIPKRIMDVSSSFLDLKIELRDLFDKDND